MSAINSLTRRRRAPEEVAFEPAPVEFPGLEEFPLELLFSEVEFETKYMVVEEEEVLEELYMV